MLQRHSSRRTPLVKTVLTTRLQGAASYDRIAGYFCSSLLEIAGEALEGVRGPVRIVCNSDIDPQDFATASAAQAALRRSWCNSRPETAPPAALPRYQALYRALTSGHLEVRVLPNSAFGLIHGKAGVIRQCDGTASVFLGSVNETAAGWTLNYELVWEDDDPASVEWVQEEFDALWNDARAVDLACCPFIRHDIQRIVERKVIEPSELPLVSDANAAAASAAVETPIYRRDQGLWPHQKYFARIALERHRLGGARLLLADQVGLGKTVQLALAALLMALEQPDGGAILVLAPKSLLQQWQDELLDLLGIPSARWNGNAWIDENDLEYPAKGPQAIGRCPRRIGLVSQGLVVRGQDEVLNQLLGRQYTCVIVDEAHRARRRKVPKVDADPDEIDGCPTPNNLMDFLLKIGLKTTSMLFATATPVQLHPVEVWDLLYMLSYGNDGVLGGKTRSSRWYTASECLAIATGGATVPADDVRDGWEFVRDPLPSRFEGEIFSAIRDKLEAEDSRWQFPPESIGRLPSAFRKVRIRSELLPEFGTRYNPLLRCIVRRTRDYLEREVNPHTGEYYLPRVHVKLFGEDDNSAITLGSYALDAYHEAERFCELLQQRVKSAGFLKTLVLRRLGSSVEAGRRTVLRLLDEYLPEAANDLEDTDDDEYEDDMELAPQGLDRRIVMRELSIAERASLRRCRELLDLAGTRDPKLEAVLHYLLDPVPGSDGRWVDLGCILFSQYYDTVLWMGGELANLEQLADVDIGLYAGSARSGYWHAKTFYPCDRNELKERVRMGNLTLLLGTDAAAEGLNLQNLGTLINIDLPWNPTRLEQRKGRIQRIGQKRREIYIANLRYKDSVEDRVHKVLADRLLQIHNLFGQIPDTLEDVWVHVALQEEAAANKLIDRALKTRNPFDQKYSKVEDADWDTCTKVLNAHSVKQLLMRGW